ncbi:MAG: ATP-binding domain-containing protein [Rhizobiaceae bacterium]
MPESLKYRAGLGEYYWMATNYNEDIERVSEESLGALEAIAASADAQLQEPYATGPHALAGINTFTGGEALKTLSGIDAAQRYSLESQSREPAIARIVVRTDDDAVIVYYICRDPAVASPGPGRRLAGSKTPVGRLAVLDVGEDFDIDTRGGGIAGVIVEKARLHPHRRGGAWDSRDSVLEGEAYGPVTLISMRDALGVIPATDIGDELFASILAAEKKAASVIDGIRRSVITKMGLRDQPILDRYQDEIYRLPLNRQLLIVGPPGTGKTTTLVRRLGQKLDREYLDDDERRLTDAARFDGVPAHADSWMMFTPTDLLKLYLKESFARERIAAPDQKISTWTRLRLDLARNRFRILRTANGGGPFVLKENAAFTRPDVLERQTAWFEDFSGWQDEYFREELRTAAVLLGESGNDEARKLARELAAIVADADAVSLARTMTALVDEEGRVSGLLQALKDETDRAIRRNLTLIVNRDRRFLDELAHFLDGLAGADDDADDAEGEDEEDGQPQTPHTRMAEAMMAYMRNVRSQARARASRRALGKTTRAGRIAEWLGERTLPEDELRALGESLQIQGALRRFTNPVRRYITGVAGRYRRFRRARQAENSWYIADTIAANDADPLETDVMLLCVMRAASTLLQDRTILRNVGEPAYALLRDYMSLVRNQVMVDEATDFSPVQLACMGALASPGIQSFFACGDFNQRITAWGSRTTEEMRWAFPKIEVRPIQVSYRHSRQLNQLATEIVRLSSGENVDVALPKNVDNEGVAPVLGTGLLRREDIVSWLAQRIVEIERFTNPLPSVAVLVNDEADVGPLADGLKEALADENLNVVACYKGQFAGQENDIRVFDVQHIKGLEFEAVFFVGVDTLAAVKPDLFDKYLYVGATRAATYLGLTCTGEALPRKIEALRDSFIADWKA